MFASVLKAICNIGTDFFEIVAGVLQKDTLAPYMFIICLDNVLQMSVAIIKENGFTLKEIRS